MLDSHLDTNFTRENGVVTSKYLAQLKFVRQKTVEANSEFRFSRLFRIMRDPAIWITAYGKISKNKGAITAGITGETIDGTSIE
jgi:hypothetical protein